MISRLVLRPADSDAENIALPTAFLLLCSLVELVLYRFLASVNAYAGVGALGMRAHLADLGTFALILTGVLSVILLIPALARLIHHRSLPGVLWRGVIVMIAPIYLLVMIWSLWTPLSIMLLIGAVAAELFTVLLLTGVGLSLPLPRLTRLMLMSMGFMMLGATIAWAALDLLEIDLLSRIGNLAFTAFQGSAMLMTIAPPILYFSLLFSGSGEFRDRIRSPHIPAVAAAVVAVLSAAGLILWSQYNSGQNMQLLAVTEFLVRMAYRCIGTTMSLPFGPIFPLISLFFLVMLVITLLVPFRSWQITRATQSIGYGLSFIYIAGLQPFTVYQLALSLLGFTLLITGLAERFPGVDLPPIETTDPSDDETGQSI